MSIRDQLTEQTDATEVTGEDALKLLVGDDGKYKSVEEMAKGTLNAQTHIATLEKELAELRDSAAKSKGIEDILEQLKAQGTQPNTDGNPDGSDQTTQQDSVSAADLIAAEFDKRDQAAAQERAKANMKQVASELQKQFGNKAADIYDKVAKECGVDLDELGAKSPQAVLRLVAGAVTPAQTQTQSTPPSTRQTAFDQNSGAILGKAAIQKMFDEGKLKRHEKIALENEQLTKLGGKLFWEN